MKKGSVYILSTVFFVIGAVVSYISVSNNYKRNLNDQRIALDSLQIQISTLNRQNNISFEQRESRPIPRDIALNLIENYCNGETTLRDSNDVILRGWHIERHLIEKLFQTYQREGATGIQVYLGKHNEGGNTSHTLIWMACKESIERRAQGDTLKMELLVHKDSTIYQYVKPCPINCPRNDLGISCD
jgi:hypothetical protein